MPLMIGSLLTAARSSGRVAAPGFTLVELLVVIGIFALGPGNGCLGNGPAGQTEALLCTPATKREK